MNRISKYLLIALTLMVALACVTSTAWACPTCKDGMAGDPAYSNMVKGYFWSIIFMMSMPFLVFSGVAAYFYYLVRCARARAAAAATAPAPADQADVSAGPEIALQN